MEHLGGYFCNLRYLLRNIAENLRDAVAFKIMTRKNILNQHQQYS